MATEKEIKVFKDLLSKGISQDRAKTLIQKARSGAPEPTQGLAQRALSGSVGIQGVPKDIAVDIPREEQSVFERAEGEKISGLDIGVKTGKTISEFGQDIKREGVGVPKKFGDIREIGDTTIANIIPDVIQGAGEIVELASDPIGTGKSLIDIGQGLSDKLVFGTLNKIFGKEVPETEQAEIVNAVGRDLKEKFGTADKVLQQITENPVDTIIFGKGIINSAKKAKISPEVKESLEKVEKTYADSLKESAAKDVEQALGATKEKFKQKGRDIAPDIAEKGITGNRQAVQQLAQEKAGEFGKEIDDFISSGKLQGTVKRDDLLNILDDIKKNGQIGDVIIDDNIVNATDKFADIISGFGPEIPAEKARTIRQMLDKAVYSTKGVIGEEALSLKNNIKKGLADGIRKQLAEQNPDLAVLNKEFTFYKTLDEVLTETIQRTGAQQGGLTSNIAGGGGLAAGGAIFGDVTGAIATAVVAKGLSEAMRSPKWRLIKASTKNKLANAISKGDTKSADSIAKEIIKKVLGNKGNIYITGQGTESNTEINK